MERRQLGTSDLHITPIGFGAWTIGGGDYAFGWGPQDDDQSVATIERAVSAGMNWIDTAAVYGLGRSEEVVGRALAGMSASSRPHVFTKCSLVWDAGRNVSHSLAPDSIRREVEDSLRRLRLDTIDLYQIHWPRLSSDVNPAIEDAWRTMVDLQRAGKVRYIGVSNFDADEMQRCAAIAPITSLQPPYSMLVRGIEPHVLPFCLQHQIGVIVYSPMVSGLLTGTMTRERIASLPEDDWRRTSSEFREPKLTQNLIVVETLRGIAARHNRTAGEVAIAWTLRHPAVTAAIVGGRKPSQIDGVIGAASLQLTGEDLDEIERALAARSQALKR